jgi:cell shape-determining protein MreC
MKRIFYNTIASSLPLGKTLISALLKYFYHFISLFFFIDNGQFLRKENQANFVSIMLCLKELHVVFFLTKKKRREVKSLRFDREQKQKVPKMVDACTYLYMYVHLKKQKSL